MNVLYIYLWPIPRSRSFLYLYLDEGCHGFHAVLNLSTVAHHDGGLVRFGCDVRWISLRPDRRAVIFGLGWRGPSGDLSPGFDTLYAGLGSSEAYLLQSMILTLEVGKIEDCDSEILMISAY